MNKISIIRASNIGFLLILSTSLVAFLHNSESKPENDNVYDSAHTACEHGDKDKTQAVITDGSHHRHDHFAPNDTYDLPEYIDGFGCDSSHIPERKNGYSEDYPEGCRNWQAMPLLLYSPHFEYWIDESSLSPLSDEEKETFIDNVDAAAAEWNSVRIKDYSSPIVELIKVSSNGAGIVPVSYDEDLPVLGRFNPIPFNYWIKLREFTGRTPLHEFGHMLGLQDLDMGDGPDVHDVLMGYTGEPLQYQDIQGLAVRHDKHQIHDYRKYYKVGSEYKYVCFYCDLTDTFLSNWYGGSHLVETSNCIHSYQEIVSAGYGLCEIDTHIFPYDVTYLRGYSNFDVVRRETGFHTKLEWGNHLNTRKNLDKIIGKYDLILVFLSNDYLEAINLIDSRTSKAKPFKLKEKAQVIFFSKNCVCPNDANCRTYIINKKLVENYNQKDDKLTGCNLTSIRGRAAFKIFQYSIECGDE